MTTHNNLRAVGVCVAVCALTLKRFCTSIMNNEDWFTCRSKAPSGRVVSAHGAFTGVEWIRNTVQKRFGTTKGFKSQSRQLQL